MMGSGTKGDLDDLSKLIAQRKYPVVDGEALHPPVGTVLDYYHPVADSDLPHENLKGLDLGERTLRDRLPIPHPINRENYYGDDHLGYWLFGLSDYLRVAEAALQYSCNMGRVYDFGGSTGRVFRHFFCQTDGIEVWSSDFKRSAHRWNQLHFPQKARVFLNTTLPLLPIPDGFFDVITAFSVFTHVDEMEIPWLLELRRVLCSGGLLYLTIHDENYWSHMPDAVANAVRSSLGSIKLDDNMPAERLAIVDDKNFDPNSYYNCHVFHTSDYVRREWGRFFEVLEIRPRNHIDQAVVLLTR